MNNPLVAIVILNFNGKNYLEKFLPGVIHSTYENLKIVVADNASADDSIAFLKERYSGTVDLISLPENYGFAEGYNRALQQTTADYYILLNSDVEVTSGWIEPVIGLMEKDKGIAFAQPKILSYNNKEFFEYAGAAGGYIDYLGYPFARGRIFDTLEKDAGQYNTSKEIFWATGAALFARAEIFRKLGGFYGFLFAHQEEIDLCWRAQLAGYKIACCVESTVYHVGGGTLPKGHRKTFLNFRNNLIMLARNLSSREKAWKIPVRLILDGIFGIKSFMKGDFATTKGILFAHFAFYKWYLGKKGKTLEEKKKMLSLSGVANNLLIFQYFIKKKKYFSDLF